MADIIKELSETDLKIAKLEREVKTLREKNILLIKRVAEMAHLNSILYGVIELLNTK